MVYHACFKIYVLLKAIFVKVFSFFGFCFVLYLHDTPKGPLPFQGQLWLTKYVKYDIWYER
jgi:hypothetical protein